MSDRPTFTSLEAAAAAIKGRLERGTPDRPHGMRTGYILWLNGTWRQYRSLAHVEKAIGHRRHIRL